jgi:hypothetical protein
VASGLALSTAERGRQLVLGYRPTASLTHDIYRAYGREGSGQTNGEVSQFFRSRQRSAATKPLVPSLKISW